MLAVSFMQVVLELLLACAGLFYKHVSTELGVGTADIVFYTTLMYFVITITLPFAGKIFSKFNIRLILQWLH